jgi:hypothetical protein
MWNAESQAPDGEPYAHDYATVTIERHPDNVAANDND